jgi:hypothetical protein
MTSVFTRTNLREAVCESLGCPTEQFEDTVFQLCLYPHARRLARLISAFSPGFFALDRAVIKEAGNAVSVREVQVEIESFAQANRQSGLLRGLLRIRLSGRRLLHLATKSLSK